MAHKPSIPKGTRDFLPTEVERRTYLFDTIKRSFKKYGFQPIETPSFELSSTLLGKYGEEGDRLLFRILNSGEKVRKADLDALSQNNLPRFANSLAEKALRYDLTVPFARFVVQHQHELSFPFKRYQIQPVWRADRPQHGRYQEFYQCDADVVGSDSLTHEIDFILLLDEVLSDLGFTGFTIKINNRKILSGIAAISGESDKLVDITVALDKLDKIGEDAVVNELREKGISENAVSKIKPLFSLSGNTEDKLDFVQRFLTESSEGQNGVEELKYIFNQVKHLGLKRANLEFDITLARGLNYYTGAIIEVKANDVNMGSICGGGRYDNLTELFGLKGMSGVGISFGADRIYDLMTELDLFPSETEKSLTLLFVNFGEKEQLYCLKLIQQIRSNGIACELYPTPSKMQKQLKYANDRNIQYVALVGENEMNQHVIELKHMESGMQETLVLSELIEKLK